MLEVILNVKPGQLIFNQGIIEYVTCVKTSNDFDHLSAPVGHIFSNRIIHIIQS